MEKAGSKPKKDTKICTKCNEEKPLSEFHLRTAKSGKYKPRCKLCANEDMREYHIKYRASGKAKDARLKYHYGIGIEDYNALLEKQEGSCAICGTMENQERPYFEVDHDHNTGNVRGLLCRECNVGLGKFKDSTALMEKAIEYLVHS